MKEAALARGAALAGVVSVVMLVVHSVILGSLPTDGSSQTAVLKWLNGHHTVVLSSAWLDGIGSILLVVTVYAMVRLIRPEADFTGQLASRMATIVIALSLVTDAALIAATHAARAGHGGPASALFNLAYGIDFVFPLANCLWLPALGVLVLRSAVLPRGFGHAAVVVGVAEFVVGTAALFSPAAAAANNVVFIALLVWMLAGSIGLAVRARVLPREIESSTVASSIGR